MTVGDVAELEGGVVVGEGVGEGEAVGDGVGGAATPFPILLVAEQPELAGAGCAGGVTGCPWKNVEEP